MTMRHDELEIEYVTPLTPVQLGMLFHALHEPAAALYVEQGVCDLIGPLDESTFARAWSHVLSRHAALRTAFFWQGLSQPLQVAYRAVRAPLVMSEVNDGEAAAPSSASEAALARHREELAALDTPPLMRLDLLRLDPTHHRIVVSIHHLVHDAWSLQVIFGEVWAAYAGGNSGESEPRPAARPFADFVQWQHDRSIADAEMFWRNQLAARLPAAAWIGNEITSLEQRGDRAVGRPSDLGVERYGHVDALFDHATTTTLQDHLSRMSVSLNSVIVGIWGLLLAARSGCDDVVMGTVMLGRPQELDGVAQMVGVFINTLPLRLRVENAMTVAAWLRGVQAAQLSLHPYEHCSLGDIRAWAGYATDRVLFDTIVVCQQVFAAEQTIEAAGVRVGAFETRGQPHYPLMLRVTPGNRLRLELVYDRQRVADTLAADVLAQVKAAVRALAESAATSLDDIRDVMAAVDRSRVDDRRRARRLPRRDAITAATAARVDRD